MPASILAASVGSLGKKPDELRVQKDLATNASDRFQRARSPLAMSAGRSSLWVLQT